MQVSYVAIVNVLVCCSAPGISSIYGTSMEILMKVLGAGHHAQAEGKERILIAGPAPIEQETARTPKLVPSDW